MRTTMMLAGWVLCTAPIAHAQSPQAPAAQAPPTQLSADEIQTLNKLHASNLREIAAGKLAEKRARTEPVRNYGEQLIKHHTEADREVKALAKRTGVQLAEPKTDLGELQKIINPANFDRAFASQMAHDHRAAIATVEAAQANASNSDVIALLQKALPVLKHHYEVAVRQVQSNPF